MDAFSPSTTRMLNKRAPPKLSVRQVFRSLGLLAG